MPTLSIERREIAAQPMLFARLRPGRHELSSAIGEGLGKVFPYSQSAGLAIAGRPFTRYLSTGPGLFNIEVGIPIASAGPGRGEVEAGSLPGGPVAVAMHAGSYDQLVETYAALQRWIEANGFRIGGPPWESCTSPTPRNFRTPPTGKPKSTGLWKSRAPQDFTGGQKIRVILLKKISPDLLFQ